jgi:hypothetical protein
MSYMTLIMMTRNCSVHSMLLERRHNLNGRQDSEGANMSTAVVHLNNKGVACLEGSRGQAHSGHKPLKRKQG